MCIGVSERMTWRSWTPARRGPGTAQNPVSSTRGMDPSSGNSRTRASETPDETWTHLALIQIFGCATYVP